MLTLTGDLASLTASPSGAERLCGVARMYRPSIAWGEGWFHPRAPGREHVSRFLPAQGAGGKNGAGGGTRTLTSVSSTDFHTAYGFRRPDASFWSARVRFVVWTIPSPSPGNPGLRCCPSSLYTFPAECSLRAWLGIAISGFPEFEQFCIAGFPDEHSSFLKSVASAGFATPA
jgi:hypothetical protein